MLLLRMLELLHTNTLPADRSVSVLKALQTPGGFSSVMIHQNLSSADVLRFCCSSFSGLLILQKPSEDVCVSFTSLIFMFLVGKLSFRTSSGLLSGQNLQIFWLYLSQTPSCRKRLQTAPFTRSGAGSAPSALVWTVWFWSERVRCCVRRTAEACQPLPV